MDEFNVVGRWNHALITSGDGTTAIARVTEATQQRLVLDVVSWHGDYDEALTVLQFGSDEGRIQMPLAYREDDEDEAGMGDHHPERAIVGLVRRYITRRRDRVLGSGAPRADRSSPGSAGPSRGPSLGAV